MRAVAAVAAAAAVLRGLSRTAARMSDPVLYFAYGSNMWTPRMHICNGTATFHDVGKLEGFSLAFVGHAEAWCGAVATVVDCPTASVCGVVWAVPQEDIHRLHAQESEYSSHEVMVQLSSGAVAKCHTYWYGADVPEQRPSLAYKAVLVAGALEHGLPQEYVGRLLAIPDNGCTRGVTIKVDMDALRSCLGGHLTL
ncbi:unnamed protein product [Ixodes hexagonus]